MIIGEDGPYYIIACEKCGAEIRKHKSFCTRYGEAYHFNPELKCTHCGFSARVLYGSSISSSLPDKCDSNQNGPELSCPECSPAPAAAGNQAYPALKAIGGVVLTGGAKAAKYMAKKGIDAEPETGNGPEFIQKRIDVKVETVIAAGTILNELTEAKMLAENTKIMIVTNFGIVEGTLKPEVEADDPAQRISMAAARMRNSRLSELEEEIVNPIITNNHYFITVLDAKVIPFANPGNVIAFAVMNLFADQIAGFTFGEYRLESILE